MHRLLLIAFVLLLSGCASTLPRDPTVDTASNRIRAHVVTNADSVAIARVACLSGSVELRGGWRPVDFRISEGSDCPPPNDESLRGTVTVRVADDARYRWEIVVELEVPPGSSPEDIDHLNEFVREVVTRLHRISEADHDSPNAVTKTDVALIGEIGLGLCAWAGIAVLVAVTVNALNHVRVGP